MTGGMNGATVNGGAINAGLFGVAVVVPDGAVAMTAVVGTFVSSHAVVGTDAPTASVVGTFVSTHTVIGTVD